MTAPHQDARLEAALKVGVTFGLGQVAELAAGVLPVTPELVRFGAGLLESGIREALSALGLSPRVDVVAGPNAVITVTIHDEGDPGAAPDIVPVETLL